MYSYVTLLSNADYLQGAVALARSLRHVQAQAPLCVLASPHLDGLEQLDALGCQLKLVEQLPFTADFRQRHSRKAQHQQAPFTKGSKPTFHNPLDNFTKLRLWQLTQFERLIFLDADTLVVRNIDHLFGYPEFCGAPNLYESLADFGRLNSGVFVAQPSEQTYEKMVHMLEEPERFWRRTDQTFLQTFFPTWHGLPYIYNTLQYVWFNLPALWDWRQIHVIHYQYEKPWQADHPRAAQLAPLIALWQEMYAQGTLSATLPEPPTHA